MQKRGGNQSLHVLRGGRWSDDPQSLRAAARVTGPPQKIAAVMLVSALPGL